METSSRKLKLKRNQAKRHMDIRPVQVLLQVLVSLWKSGLSEFFLLIKYCVRHLQGQALGELLKLERMSLTLIHLFFSTTCSMITRITSDILSY